MLGLVPEAREHEDGQARLARLAWSITAAVCLLTAAIVGLEGYFGYAIVTLAVAIAAAINLG